MEPVSESEIRAAFDGQINEVFVPDLETVSWDLLDYLGWVHPNGRIGYIVLVSPLDGSLKGTRLQRSTFSSGQSGFEMCSLCHHLHRPNGTAMFTVKCNDSHRHRSIGNVVCKELDCSLRIRNKIEPASCLNETLYLEAKVWRMQLALHRWLKSANRL